MQHFELRGQVYNDPYVGLQHGPDSMRVWEAHPITDGSGITVAVVDSGVDCDHPDLARSVAVVRDFVGAHPRRPGPAEMHGTAIAGIISSTPDNGLGTVGVAPAARIVALRACAERGDGTAGGCNTFTLAKALAYVVDHRPDVLNLSLNGPADPLLTRLLAAALDLGVIVVTTKSDRRDRPFPAVIDGVLVVGLEGPATEDTVLRAPGEEILTTVPGGAFDFVTGASFATAHVSGVVALLLERAPDLTASQLRTLLLETSRNPAPFASGFPRVNACVALSRVVPDASVSCSPWTSALAVSGRSAGPN